MEFNITDTEKSIFHFISMAISILNPLLCINKYRYRIKFARIKGDIFKDQKVLGHPIFMKFLFEVLMLLNHPSPFLISLKFTQLNYETNQTQDYRINDIFIIIAFICFPYQINEYFNATKYNSHRIVRINSIFNNDTIGASLPIRNFIAGNPIRFMILSFVMSILYFSSLLIIMERPSSKIGSQDLQE